MDNSLLIITGLSGAGKSLAVKALEDLGAQVIIVSRSGENNYDNLHVHQDAAVIVNTTPVGMYPNTEEYPQLPYEAMDNRTLLYDLIYNPDKTMFMKLGEKQGAVVKNGLEMLLLQAYASWEFWHEDE